MKKAIVVILAILVLATSAMAATVNINPDGQGYWKKWRHVGCSSGNNEWDCVDEDPVSTSDYLREGRTNDKESFTFSNTGLSGVTINSLTFHYHARWHNKLSNSCFNAHIRSGGVDYQGSTQICTDSSWDDYSYTFTTNPATGVAWTVAEVDALEAGMIATNPNSGGAVAQMYIVVDYSLADSCSDTDGGNQIYTTGTTSGTSGGSPYSNDDYCVDSANVFEYYCSGTQEQSSQQSCGTDGYGGNYCVGEELRRNFVDYFCAGGACDSNSTPELVEDCDDADATGANFCQSGDVYHNVTDGHCAVFTCAANTTTELVEACSNGCSAGVCLPEDSCSDTDGGFVTGTVGTTSGNASGLPYSNTDYCVDTSTVNEYYCSGTQEQSSQSSCGTDNYSTTYCGAGETVYHDFTDFFCDTGACDSTTTPLFVEDCDDLDEYSANYCSSGDVYRNFTDGSCGAGSCSTSVTPELVESCTYGCTAGTCDSQPDSCTDDDGGFVYTIMSNTSGVAGGNPYLHTDFCVGDVLYEYGCSGSTLINTSVDCVALNYTRCLVGFCF